MIRQNNVTHSVSSSGLADILERILDKGVVICGDIKIKLVDIELLTIQIRLMIASVDKAKELGIDWWLLNPEFSSRNRVEQSQRPPLGVPVSRSPEGEVVELREQMERIQARLDAIAPTP
jgi:hypothetical protein